MERSTSTGLIALAAVGMSVLSGCGREVPVPTDIDELGARDNARLVDHTVILKGEAHQIFRVEGSRWVQPPPAMLPMGKGIAVVPQIGYTVPETSYVYEFKTPGAHGGGLFSNIVSADPIADGPAFLVGTFHGLNEEGAIQLDDCELVAAPK